MSNFVRKTISMNTETIKLSQININARNPRKITEEQLKRLVRSLLIFPEMLNLRPIAIDETYTALGGNMRYRALTAISGMPEEEIRNELEQTDSFAKKTQAEPDALLEYWTQWAQMPTAVIVRADKLTDAQKQEFIIKDNVSFGEWDDAILAEDFDPNELVDWGLGDLAEEGNEEADADEDDYTDEDAENAPTRCTQGDIWLLGKHRLMCGDSTKESDVARLMGGEQANLLLTDPPYNVDYQGCTKDKMKIANDNMDDVAFLSFLTAAFNCAIQAMKPGAVFYVWHADSKGWEFRSALKEVGLVLRETLIWVKNALVLGRQDYQWRHEPCQPAGTMVETTTGVKPIEELRDGDRVISYDSLSGQVKGRRNGGYGIRTANRQYDGLLYSITAAGKTTRATDNHEFSVRFNPGAKANYCTYLMRRGRWWRVGQTKAYDARQFGLKTRLNQERADEIWLLSIHEDKVAAQVMEQIITCKYGIPYTIWEQDRFGCEPKRTPKQIASIYDALDLDEMEQNACQLLHDFNRSERFPFITKESKREKFSTRVTARIRACNLVPELMQLPIPTGGSEFEWRSIEAATAERFTGTVYSLAVQQYQHYIADGIITHNCLYGWKDGAAHYFIDDRSQSTVIEDAGVDYRKMKKEELLKVVLKLTDVSVPNTVIYEDKPTKNDIHPTMKPVKLMARLIRNSTRQGELVLDLFGGSGSTLIACEQIGRKCFMMEYDPKYCDAIIDRWEKLTGEKAERIYPNKETL